MLGVGTTRRRATAVLLAWILGLAALAGHLSPPSGAATPGAGEGPDSCTVLQDDDLARDAAPQRGTVPADGSPCFELRTPAGATVVVHAAGGFVTADVRDADGDPSCATDETGTPPYLGSALLCTLTGSPPYRLDLLGGAPGASYALQVLALDGPGACPAHRLTALGTATDLFAGQRPTDGVLCWDVHLRPGALVTTGAAVAVVGPDGSDVLCDLTPWGPGLSSCVVDAATEAHVLAVVGATSPDVDDELDPVVTRFALAGTGDGGCERTTPTTWGSPPERVAAVAGLMSCWTIDAARDEPLLLDTRAFVRAPSVGLGKAAFLVLDADGADACAGRVVRAYGLACVPTGPPPYRMLTSVDVGLPLAHLAAVRSLRPGDDCPVLGHSPFGTPPDPTAPAVGCRRIVRDPTDLGLPSRVAWFDDRGEEQCHDDEGGCLSRLAGPLLAVTSALDSEQPWVRYAATERRGCRPASPGVHAQVVEVAPRELTCHLVTVGEDRLLEVVHTPGDRGAGYLGGAAVLDDGGEAVDCDTEWPPQTGSSRTCTVPAPGTYRVVGPFRREPLGSTTTTSVLVLDRRRLTTCTQVAEERTTRVVVRAGHAVCLRIPLRLGRGQEVAVRSDEPRARPYAVALAGGPGSPVDPCAVRYDLRSVVTRIDCLRGPSYAAAGVVLVVPDRDQTLTLVRTATVPRVVDHPSVWGRPRPGGTLHVSPGVWDPVPSSYRYRWLLDGRPVRGATGPRLRVRRAFVGSLVQVVVTADGPGLAPGTATSSGVLVRRRGTP